MRRGPVARVADRPFSSFHRDVPADWTGDIGQVGNWANRRAQSLYCAASRGRWRKRAIAPYKCPPWAGAGFFTANLLDRRSRSAHREDRCIARRHFADASGPPLPYPRTRGRGERGIWQGRFWEHLIRDDEDYRRHVDYCSINPMRHGLVARVFHSDVGAGLFPADRTGDIGRVGEFGRTVERNRFIAPPASRTGAIAPYASPRSRPCRECDRSAQQEMFRWTQDDSRGLMNI
jgi:hypothetical protein